MKHLNQLTKPQFLNRIYNYELNPNKFVYVGTAPSMIVFSSPENRFCIELEPALEIIAKKNMKHYPVYYINTAEEPELGRFFTSGRVPVIYLCPVSGEPTIIKETINIRDIVCTANRLFGNPL